MLCWSCGSVVPWPARGTCVLGLLALTILCSLGLPRAVGSPSTVAGRGRTLAATRATGGVVVRRGGGVIFEVAEHGATVSAGSGVALRLGLSALGRGRALEPVPAVAPAWRANRVSYARPGVLEWYSIGAPGLEQRFALTHRISGSGMLTLAVGSVPSGERAQLGRGGSSLTLVTRPVRARCAMGIRLRAMPTAAGCRFVSAWRAPGCSCKWMIRARAIRSRSIR